jgi:hypothetical protein
VALGAAALAALVGRDAAAAATAALAERTARAALAFAAGTRLDAALASANAVQLAHAGAAAVVMNRVAIVALAVVGLALVALQWSGAFGDAGQPPAPKLQAAAEKPKVAPAAPRPDAPADPTGDPVITAGLKWLVKDQKDDGHWTMEIACGSNGAAKGIAATGLALMPMLAAGSLNAASPASKPFGPSAKKGLAYLIKVQKADGAFDPFMYAHGIGAWAMCEAYAQNADAEYRNAAQQALDYIVAAQSPKGSWGYLAKQERGDSSISGWQCLALASGKRAGLKVPNETWKKYGEWLDSVAVGDGSYGYASKDRGGVAVTAECLLGRLETGWLPERPEFVKGIEFLQALPDSNFSDDPYTGLFAALLMNRQGADTYAWTRRLRADLVRTQHKDGSWPAGGRMNYPPLFNTATKLLSLQARSNYVALATPPEKLSDDELAGLWRNLTDRGVAPPARAMRLLAARPERSVPFLAAQLKPIKAADAKRVAELIEKLECDDFAVRQQAEGDLAGFGEGAKEDLEKALKRPAGSLEFRRLLERLLERLDDNSPNPDRLRQLRALRVLEYAGTTDAVKVLRALAAGAPRAALTIEAAASLKRLGKE